MNTSLNTRIIHTHDTAENWELCTSFIPKAGELIVYDIDGIFDYERFKIGDGINSVTDLPFSTDIVVKTLFGVNIDNTITLDAGRITQYTTTPVEPPENTPEETE